MSEFIDNSKYRQQKLKELIKQLHEGKSIDEVKEEFKKDFKDVSTSEISQIEQALVKEAYLLKKSKNYVMFMHQFSKLNIRYSRN